MVHYLRRIGLGVKPLGAAIREFAVVSLMHDLLHQFPTSKSGDFRNQTAANGAMPVKTIESIVDACVSVFVSLTPVRPPGVAILRKGRING